MATSTRKTTSAAAKTAATPEPEAGAAAPAPKAPTFKIKDLIGRVAEATGGKKKGLKETVEATLAALGEALSRGEDLNLPGLGRARVARSAEKDGASHLTLKVRRGPHKKKETTEPLADETDDG